MQKPKKSSPKFKIGDKVLYKGKKLIVNYYRAFNGWEYKLWGKNKGNSSPYINESLLSKR